MDNEPSFFDNGTLKATGGIMQGTGAAMQMYAQILSYRTEAAAYRANAKNIRKEAESDFATRVAEEGLMRINQERAIGSAVAEQAGSGFTDAGTGNVGARTVAGQYEQTIANAGHARDVGYQKQQHAASLQEWQATLAKNNGKKQVFGTVLESAGKIALGMV